MKLWPFGDKRSVRPFGNNKIGWIRLYASVSSEIKTVHKISSRSGTLSIYIKIYLQPYVYHHHLQKCFLHHIELLVSGVTLSENTYISKLFFFSFLFSRNHIWHRFLYFVVIYFSYNSSYLNDFIVLIPWISDTPSLCNEMKLGHGITYGNREVVNTTK